MLGLLTCRATYCESLGCMLISQTNSRGCNACINHTRAPEKCTLTPSELVQTHAHWGFEAHFATCCTAAAPGKRVLYLRKLCRRLWR